MIELPRRRFLTGIATLFAAPAIVRAASIMPVKPVPIIARRFPTLLDIKNDYEAYTEWFTRQTLLTPLDWIRDVERCSLHRPDA